VPNSEVPNASRGRVGAGSAAEAPLPVARWIAILVVLFLIVIGAIVALGTSGLNVLAGLQAFVGAESHWSKGQKDAALALSRYLDTGDEADYRRFLGRLAVPLGDRKARLALQQPSPDVRAAQQGFLEGRNSLSSVEEMARLFLRYKDISAFSRAVEAWERGDLLVDEMIGLGTRIHEAPMPLPPPARAAFAKEIDRLNERATVLEDAFSVAIGQGAVTVTPIQLARMAAAVASGGTLVQPHFLKGYASAKIEHFPLSDEAVDKVTQGLFGVVNEGGGTAYHLRLANIDLCGKSGTAQLMSYDAANRLGTKKMDGWFVGFAPRRNPEIVVAAIVQDTMEHGGEAAGPVVRDIVKLYYDKKAAHTQQQAGVETPAQPNVSRPLVATVGGQHP